MKKGAELMMKIFSFHQKTCRSHRALSSFVWGGPAGQTGSVAAQLLRAELWRTELGAMPGPSGRNKHPESHGFFSDLEPLTGRQELRDYF